MDRVFGLLGSPVEHSLSPPMQNAAFRELGMEARYHAFEVEELEEAVMGAVALGFGGLNVTIPHKRPVTELCDSLSVDAEAVDAVNTLEFHDGVTGHNTDVEGVGETLRREVGDLDGLSAMVLGAGGAARAMVVALARAGCRVTVLNRTADRAEEVAGLASPLGTEADHGGLDRRDEAGDHDIVLNATPVGTESDETLLTREDLRGASYVFDAVYRPVRTRLLREAEAAGARPIDGVGMLVLQGAASLRIWTGCAPPVRVMEEAVRGRLG